MKIFVKSTRMGKMNSPNFPRENYQQVYGDKKLFQHVVIKK